MDLMSITTEIRLAIYDNLLVNPDGPITFVGEFVQQHDELMSRLTNEQFVAPILTPRIRVRPSARKLKLWPALLRVSKQVNNEAISILYSKNCFGFSALESTSHHTRPRHPIADFLDKIGARNSGLIRHVCVGPFPGENGSKELALHGIDVLRNHPNPCLSITTIDFSLELDIVDRLEFLDNRDSWISRKSVDLVIARLKSFPSLQEVKVNLRLVDWEESDMQEDESDEDDDEDDGSMVAFGQEQNQQEQQQNWAQMDTSPLPDFVTKMNAPTLALIKQMANYGWVVEVIKVAPADSVGYEWDPEDYIIIHTPLCPQACWTLPEDYMFEPSEEDDSEYYRERQLWAYSMDYADDGGPA